MAFTPGAANFKPAAAKSFFPTQYRPRNASGEDTYQESVQGRLANPVTTPDWNYYHRWDGEVHCGTAAKRQIFNFKWWERLP